MGQLHDQHEDVVTEIVGRLRLDAAAESALYLALQELQLHQVELEQQNLALHEAQQALEASRDRYSTLYDFAPIGYASLSSRGIIQDINMTGAALLGQERSSLIGHPLANQLVSGGSRRELFSFLRRASTSRGHPSRPRGRATGEVQITATDIDRPRTVRLDGLMVTDNEGGETCLTSLVDITDNKLMERDIRLSNAKLSSILTAAPIGIGLVRDRTFQWLNPRFLQMVGYADHELIGKSSTAVYPDDREFHRGGLEKYEQIAATGSSEIETRFRCKDGGIRDIFLRSTLLNRTAPDEGAIFTAMDITERKLAEKRQHLASSVLENVSWGVMVTDASLCIVETNPAFSRITGYSTKELLGRDPQILSSGRHSKEFYESMRKQLVDTGKWEGEMWNRRKSGSVFPGWITISQIRDAAGDVSHYACTLTDITNQMQLPASN